MSNGMLIAIAIVVAMVLAFTGTALYSSTSPNQGDAPIEDVQPAP